MVLKTGRFYLTQTFSTKWGRVEIPMDRHKVFRSSETRGMAFRSSVLNERHDCGDIC